MIRCLAGVWHSLSGTNRRPIAGRSLLGFLAFTILVSCASPRIDLKDPGSLEGVLMVFWVGEDNFVYYPYNKNPLTYHLPKSLQERLGGIKSIRPGLHYNDGGSIPRAVRGVEGFSPWGYGPAYAVHDWLFAAHHCIVTEQRDLLDKRDEDETAKVEQVDFPASADILAGVISALVLEKRVPPRAVAPGAIYSAVDSFVARNIWNDRDPGSCKPVSDDDLKKIESAVARGALKTLTIENATPPVLVFQQEF